MTVIALWRPAALPALPRRRAPVRARHQAALSTRSRAVLRGRGRSRSTQARTEVSWELRSFSLAAGAIAVGFVLALAFLTSSTGVSSLGYETQRLQAERDELRRQNALLEVQLAKLASPARIQDEAARLGLTRVSFVPVVPAEPVAARR